MRTGMLIGGEWAAGNGTTFTTVTPATGEVLAEPPEARAGRRRRRTAAARAFTSSCRGRSRRFAGRSIMACPACGP
ncbi:hypothetical protein [Streptomyces sp. 8N616]|uniref:hypothetical protein n=1 Tax=Streptomyces sp. 8N616 TaxID=3457414 RepID=UPI003FD30E37